MSAFPTITPDDGYDFLELVIFDSKVLNDSFAYAFEHYGPRFRRAELRPLETDFQAFETFYNAHTDAVDAWWDAHDDDGDTLFDQHLAEHDKESERRKADPAAPAPEYLIAISCCDDGLSIVLALTPGELATVQRLADLTQKHGGGCKPTVRVVPVVEVGEGALDDAVREVEA